LVFRRLYVIIYTELLGALAELNNKGIKVPGEVLLAGFDDIAEAKPANPSLSTVCQPIKQLGEIAAEVLLAQIYSEQVPDIIKPDMD